MPAARALVVPPVPKRSDGSQTSRSMLSETRRQKLQACLERENRKTKQSRMAGTLCQQFIAKYGTKSKSEVNAAIERLVHDYMNTLPDTGTVQSVELEGRVKAAAQQARQHMRDMARTRKEDLERAQRARDAAANAENASKTASALEKVSSNLASDWSLLDAIAILEHEDEQKRKAEKRNAMRARMNRDLQEQLKFKEIEKMRRDEEKKRTVQEFSRQAKEWEREQQLKREEQSKQFAKEKQIREAMIRSRQAEAERKKLLAKEEERWELERAKAELADEERMARERVQKERQRLEAIMRENEKEKAERQRKIDDQWAADKKQMQDYQAKLDREEEEKKRVLQVRADRLKAAARQYESSSGVEIARKEAEEWKKIQKELSKKELADAERESRDRLQLQQQKERIFRDNKALVEARSKRLARERQDNLRQARALQAQAELAMRKDEQRKRARQKQRQDHVRLLEEQIRSLRIQNAKESMTVEERKLNRDRILKLEALANQNVERVEDVLKDFPHKSPEKAAQLHAAGSRRRPMLR